MGKEGASSKRYPLNFWCLEFKVGGGEQLRRGSGDLQLT